jgi:hypothetical protein
VRGQFHIDTPVYGTPRYHSSILHGSFANRDGDLCCDTKFPAAPGFACKRPLLLALRNLAHDPAQRTMALSSARRASALTCRRYRRLATAAAAQQLLNGHRAILMGPTAVPAAAGSEQQPRPPPLVLVGGTAQWLDSWAGHLPALAKERQCLLYEARGQAGGMRDRDGLPPLDLSDCTLPQHADDFWAVVAEARAAGLLDFDEAASDQELDVLGFSFGSRVAMAAAASAGVRDRPRIRRLCLTGAAGDRGAAGRLALASWRASLAAADLRGFAWRLILDTHSPAYLAKQ